MKFKHQIKSVVEEEHTVSWELKLAADGYISLMATCNGIQYCVAMIDENKKKLTIDTRNFDKIGLEDHATIKW